MGLTAKYSRQASREGTAHLVVLTVVFKLRLRNQRRERVRFRRGRRVEPEVVQAHQAVARDRVVSDRRREQDGLKT